MTEAKKVEFIERVSKSILGLEGLQIVVYCDRNRFGSLSNEEKTQVVFSSLYNFCPAFFKEKEYKKSK